jgi:glycosyltransferase involved in cell wall biosynthesis
MKKPDTILYLGENGFPFRMAAINRQKYIARGLVHNGWNVEVLCRKGVHETGDKRLENIQSSGTFESVRYKYCSGSIYRPKGLVSRNLQKVMGFFGEFKEILKYKRCHHVEAMVVTTFSYTQIVYYKLLSVFLKSKILLDVVEKNSTIAGRNGFLQKLNDFFYERYCYGLMDGILVISDQLKAFVQGITRKPIAKIPVVFDYDRIKPENKLNNTGHPYLLFCGHANYIHTIDFILEAYNLVETKSYDLKIVSNGSQLNKVNTHISSHPRSAQISLLSGLTDEALFDLYKNANALLIPLFNTPQDIARFPQKISEYLASGNPIVSTNVGEVAKYFDHGKNAFLAEPDNRYEFSKMMDKAYSSSINSNAIGSAGRKLGLENFDFRKIGLDISNFIKAI